MPSADSFLFFLQRTFQVFNLLYKYLHPILSASLSQFLKLPLPTCKNNFNLYLSFFVFFLLQGKKCSSLQFKANSYFCLDFSAFLLLRIHDSPSISGFLCTTFKHGQVPPIYTQSSPLI